MFNLNANRADCHYKQVTFMPREDGESCIVVHTFPRGHRLEHHIGSHKVWSLQVARDEYKHLLANGYVKG